jgi:hypothetical protein
MIHDTLCRMEDLKSEIRKVETCNLHRINVIQS